MNQPAAFPGKQPLHASRAATPRRNRACAQPAATVACFSA